MLINQENIDEILLSGQTEDFNYIREKALEYIRQLSAETWTDHNLHDPGITILEAIAYALTDIGFRMNLKMPDLMTDQQGNFINNAFYLPDQIFPTRAVTLNDFRKLIIDIPSVRNAWFKPITKKVEEIELDYEPLFVDHRRGVLLTRDEVNELMIPLEEKAQIISQHEIFIQGFYALQIAFDYQFKLGAIDSGEMFEAVYDSNLFGDIFYDVSNWKDLVNNRKALSDIAELFESNPEKLVMNFEVSVKNKYNNNDGKLFDRVLNEWVFNIQIRNESLHIFTLSEVLFIPYLKDKHGISGHELLYLLTRNNFSFFGVCLQKISALSKVYKDILQVLHQNRNLCEEFLPQLSAIPSVELRICMDIDVSSDGDVELIQAKVFNEIINYISPQIHFYSKEELLNKGLREDEIYEGPLLTHGFLLESEMGENSFEHFTFNTSDIINAIFEIEGFLNCRNIQLMLFNENGDQIEQSNMWEIKIPIGYKPILNLRRSKLLFYKNDLPLTPNYKESLFKLSFLQTNRKPINYELQKELIIPHQYRSLSTHYSIANEFPATYKIGKNFPDSFLNNSEYSSSKQLEGYLLLFEQIMANMLKDLDQFKEALSWNQVSHIQYNSTDNEWRRPYLLSNHVDIVWQNLNESSSEFLSKRNEGLDFLLARFAENLSGIDNYFYLTTDNLGIERNQYYSYLIHLKEHFLEQFPVISAHRGSAIDLYSNIDYLQIPLSGFELRLSCLLGCNFLQNGLRRLSHQIQDEIADERGYFHILEHILFRIPKIPDEVRIILKQEGIAIALPSICIEGDCISCQDTDPYSSKATVLLPSWLKLYSDIHYRDFIEKRIRQEAPTHLLLRICWIDKVAMHQYEMELQNWWALRYKLFKGNSQNHLQFVEYIKVQNKFLQLIKNQRSDYFPATLHGCDDEGDENNTRVFLNKTILGNPKN